MALVTMILRFLPFMIFRDRETPEYINFLGKYLPYSIMGMLVVYCLKDVSITSSPFGIPELISVVLVAVLHFWKRNTLVSIVSGTVCYMLLIQVF
ncbi:AzlD domain-containing protein [Tissierellaceae bacterium BX21]|uniref:AzlD domain-containing protein n=2 Tax=Paratissierella segnis TaxID=2763679 RepID=A0A926EWK9_9FIRM|nr:AzlD domain-containing protein [Paratissierella segnis]